MVLNRAQSHSAVLVLHDLSSDSLILTKRSEHLRHHPGEISFPGGHWEEQDKSLYATALREVYEELGIESSRITMIKELRIEETLLGSIIHPWLTEIETINPFKLNPNEVTDVIAIPVSQANKADNYKSILFERNGYKFKSWKYIPTKEVIWGATARIMMQLAQK